jgi:hypothetical protein
MKHKRANRDYEAEKALTEAQWNQLQEIDFYDLAETAFHEASHVVVALQFDYGCEPVIEMWQPGEGEARGKNWLGRCEYNTPDDPHEQVLISIAGEIGACMVGGAVADSVTAAKVLYWLLDTGCISRGDRAGLLDPDDRRGGVTQEHVDECFAILKGAWPMVEAVAGKVMDNVGVDVLGREKGWYKPLLAAFYEYQANQTQGSVWDAEDTDEAPTAA